MGNFWIPTSIQEDIPFQVGILKYFRNILGSNQSPSTPHRRSKRYIKWKHGIIIGTFNSLHHEMDESPKYVHALQAVCISYDLYGNDIDFAYEIGKDLHNL